MAAVTNSTRRIQSERVNDAEDESDPYLAAGTFHRHWLELHMLTVREVWERRSFSLRTNFLAEVEKELTKLSGEMNHTRKEGEL